MALRGLINLANPDGSVSRHHLYINKTTGNDTTGRGTAARPYATIERALADVPLPYNQRDTTANEWTNGIFFLHTLGSDQVYSFPEGFIFPNKICRDFDIQAIGADVDLVNLPGLQFEAPLNIVGHPLLTSTILDAAITAQTPMAKSGMIILDCNSAVNPGNALKGQLLVDGSNVLNMVVFNDNADTSFVPIGTSVAIDQTPSVKTYRTRATLRGVDASPYPSLQMSNLGTSLLFYGLALAKPVGGSELALQLLSSTVYTYGCSVEGLSSGLDSNNQEAPAFFQGGNTRLFNAVDVYDGWSYFQGCLLDQDTSFFSEAGANILAADTYINQPSTVVFGNSYNELLMNNCEIFEGAADGIKPIGPSQVNIADSNISSCVNNGMTLVGPVYAKLSNVGHRVAVNGGVGIQLIGNVQCAADTNVSVSGTGGDVLCGGQPTESYANIGSGGVPFAMKDTAENAVFTFAVTASLDNKAIPRRVVATTTATPRTSSSIDDVVVEDATAGAKIVNLQVITAIRGQTKTFIKKDNTANTVTINAAGGNTILGAASYVLSAQFQAVKLIAPDSGTDWLVESVGGGGASAVGLPPGAIVAYGSPTVPAGWLECNGASLLRTAQPALFAAIGTAYGTADGTHFSLPDLRGKFARGWDHGAGNDLAAAGRTAQSAGGAVADNVGSVQPNLTKLPTTPFQLLEAGAAAVGATALVVAGTVGSSLGQSVVTMTGGDVQTNSLNVNTMYIIKT